MLKKMKHRVISFLSVFIFVFSILCSPLYVYASDVNHGGGGSSVYPDSWDEWTFEEKAYWFGINFDRIVTGTLGFLSSGDSEQIVQQLLKTEYDYIKQGEETYEEWVARNIGIEEDSETGDPQLLISDELSDAMYQACMKYVNEYTGWVNLYSYDVEMFYKCFGTQAGYEQFKKILDSRKSNQIAIFSFVNARPLLIIFDYDGLYLGSNSFNSSFNAYYSIKSDSSWIPKDYDMNKDNGYKSANAEFHVWTFTGLEDTATWTENVSISTFAMHTGVPVYPSIGGSGMSPSYWYVIDDVPREYRVYRTLEDYKQYNVGARPYFITDKFQDYDVNGDNSCILSESELNGSSLYGDVVNYIINNYGDDADGLTEEELRAILEEYLNGSGGGSGSGSSGGGLLDFIDGLGGLFDGILSILGKLLEYIGKAITMIVDLITNIIDVIPANIGKLFTALFPFLPEEFFTAIELALVLGVVAIVIKLFKG